MPEDSDELVRYVHPDERNRGRASVSAFLLNEQDFKRPDAHLSVNSLAIEPIETITKYYQLIFQGADGDVSACSHKVSRYVKLGTAAGAALWRDNKEEPWTFYENGTAVQAFKPRPVKAANPSRSSSSHCGVEFIRSLDVVRRNNLARELAKYPKYRVFTVAK